MLHVAACVHPLHQCNQLAPHAPSSPASAAVPLPLPLLLVLPQVEQLQKKLATPSYQEKTPEEVKAAGEPLGRRELCCCVETLPAVGKGANCGLQGGGACSSATTSGPAQRTKLPSGLGGGPGLGSRCC